MKKMIFVLVYSLAALSIFSYGKAAENEQLIYCISGQYANKMTDASKKLEELDTAVKKTLLFNEADGPQKHVRTFGVCHPILKILFLHYRWIQAFQHHG